jgi:hypothetical protein
MPFSGFIDSKPLLVASTPELREYSLRFWDDDSLNGNWPPVQQVTVSP